MNRAHSLFEIKSLDDDRRTLSGWATTPTPDRAKDVIDPYGCRFAADIPLFLYHDATKTVGRVQFGKPTARGIPFEAQLPKISEPGTLKDRVNEAYLLCKHKLITGVSVGFLPDADKVEVLKGGGIRYGGCELIELSLTPIPMQSEARIETVRSLDAQTHAPSRSTGATMKATLHLDQTLQLELRSGDNTQAVRVELTRLEAQEMADSLLAYSNAISRPATLKRSFDMSVKDLTGLVRKGRPGVVYLDDKPASGGRVVRLTQAEITRASSKGRGPVYLNKP